MVPAMMVLCCQLMACAEDPESISGRPLNNNRFGLIDCVLFLHEEYYIRRGECFNGKVIEKTEDTITVKKWRSVARVFRVSPSLTSDRIPLEGSSRDAHRLSHVRVGDMVGMSLSQARDGYVVTGLGIYRRPGGKIPEGEDYHVPEKYRLHNRCMTEQIVEDVLVPKLLPTLMARFLHYSLPR